MMRKTVKTNQIKKAEVLNTPEPKTKQEKPKKINGGTFSFPVGTKFLLNGKLNIIRKAYKSDNTEFRLVFCDATEEIVMLSTLRMEARDDKDFTLTE